MTWLNLNDIIGQMGYDPTAALTGAETGALGDASPDIWNQISGTDTSGSTADTSGNQETGGTATGNPSDVTAPSGGGPSAWAGQGGGSFPSSTFGKALQMAGLLNRDGTPNLLGLAGLLGPALTAGLQYGKTGQATDQTVAGINNASNQVNQILGQNSPFAAYAPLAQSSTNFLGGYHFNPINMGPLGGQANMMPSGNSLGSLLRGK